MSRQTGSLTVCCQGIAPYFDSPGVDLDPTVPDSCTIQRAAYLVRHSSIYGNDYDYENVIQVRLLLGSID